MTSLHHIALGARDVPRVARFYRTVLGLHQVAEHLYDDGTTRSVWLSLDTAVLMIEHTTESRDRVEGVGAGAFLIAVDWPRGLADAIEWLGANGIEIEGRSEFSIYCRDPEGGRVAISVYPLPSIRCTD